MLTKRFEILEDDAVELDDFTFLDEVIGDIGLTNLGEEVVLRWERKALKLFNHANYKDKFSEGSSNKKLK